MSPLFSLDYAWELKLVLQHIGYVQGAGLRFMWGIAGIGSGRSQTVMCKIVHYRDKNLLIVEQCAGKTTPLLFQ